jgi:hypothetical protein
VVITIETMFDFMTKGRHIQGIVRHVYMTDTVYHFITSSGIPYAPILDVTLDAMELDISEFCFMPDNATFRSLELHRRSRTPD